MSIKDVIKNSVLEGFSSEILTSKIIVTLGITAILGIYIFLVYKNKSKSTFYSKSFNVVLATLPVITAGIVLAMQSSIVISLGMVGALSIVRFRNAVKNSMDLLFLFWSISIGIICGAGIYEIGIILSLVTTILLYSLDLIPAASKSLLLIVNSHDVNCENDIIKAIIELSIKYIVKSRSISKDQIDLIIEVKTKKEKDLITKLSAVKSIDTVNLLQHDGETRF